MENLNEMLINLYTALKSKIDQPLVFHKPIEYVIIEDGSQCRCCGKVIEDQEVHLITIDCIKYLTGIVNESTHGPS